MTESSRISKPTKGQIECPVRALIINDGKILLCRGVDKDNYFLPGGHVEFGEYASETLKREIMEELGVEVLKFQALGFVDNIYEDINEGMKRHEVNLLFSAELVSFDFKFTEDHIKFDWIEFKDIEKINLLPVSIKKFVAERINS